MICHKSLNSLGIAQIDYWYGAIDWEIELGAKLDGKRSKPLRRHQANGINRVWIHQPSKAFGVPTAHLGGGPAGTFKDLIVDGDNAKPVPHSLQSRTMACFPEFSEADNSQPDGGFVVH